jgi:hypothetical protein
MRTTLPVLAPATAVRTLLADDRRESLIAWLGPYMGLEAGACSENTFRAKHRDLEGFLSYIACVTGSDHPDQGTRSLTVGYLKARDGEGKSPVTINRALATAAATTSGVTSSPRTKRRRRRSRGCSEKSSFGVGRQLLGWFFPHRQHVLRLHGAQHQGVAVEVRERKSCTAWWSPSGWSGTEFCGSGASSESGGNSSKRCCGEGGFRAIARDDC